MLHFIFPADPLEPRKIDEYFAPQRDAFSAAGFSTSVLPRGIPRNATVVYRGWMLDETEYRAMTSTIEQAGATQLTSPVQYLLTHHLPNWYPHLRDLTAETVVYPEQADLAQELSRLGWPAFFLKDYVKSLKTSTGSLITDPQSAPKVIEEMRRFRGTIEGGICVRRAERFRPDSEVRYFVLHGRAHAAGGAAIPPIVDAVAPRIASPFFSIDIAIAESGEPRVVEVGDGQVSDLVGWPVDNFVRLWQPD